MRRGVTYGQAHPKARLSDEQVIEIYDLHHEAGLSYGEISRRFAVPKSTVRDFCTLQTRFCAVLNRRKKV